MRQRGFLTFLFSTSIVCALWAALPAPAQAQLYEARDLNISFYSHTPLKDITAYSTNGTSSFHAEKQEITFNVEIASFVFFRLLMQEHFNRKFMESNRYPRATFKGNLVDDIDLSVQGTRPVTVQGTLEIHGKKTKREIEGYLTVKADRIVLESTFIVNAAEHRIHIPTSLSDRIAQDIEVKVRGEYAPYDHLVKK